MKLSILFWETSVKAVYMFGVSKLLLGNLANLAFGIKYQNVSNIFDIINQPWFAALIVIIMTVGIVNLWIQNFWIYVTVATTMLTYASIIAFSFISKTPTDAIWVRNFSEASFYAWLVIRLQYDYSHGKEPNGLS